MFDYLTVPDTGGCDAVVKLGVKGLDRPRRRIRYRTRQRQGLCYRARPLMGFDVPLEEQLLSKIRKWTLSPHPQVVAFSLGVDLPHTASLVV